MSENSTFRRAGYLNENYHYFHLKDSAGQERSFHFHEFDKIVLLLSGKVDYIVEGITYTLKPGSVLLVRHHAIHKAIIDITQPYNRVILYLDRKYFERTMPNAGLMECFKTADSAREYMLLPDKKDQKDLNSLIQSYETAEKDARYGSQVMRDTLVMQMLVIINRISSSGAAGPKADRHFDEKIRRVLSYINENLSGDLSVNVLADQVYLSRYHFMRLFKLQTGSTVHSYVRQKRLLYAARLIREGVPAGQAASECGFNDYSVFNRAFRDSFGVRPADLKKE